MMEGLAQLEALCERLYNSQDSAERAHAESTLKCLSVNVDYISQCQYILDNAVSPYALMLASSSLLKQVTDHSLSLQLRLDISNVLIHMFLPVLGLLGLSMRFVSAACYLWLVMDGQPHIFFFLFGIDCYNEDVWLDLCRCRQG